MNVATVPNRSPFRYPGGKTWLVPVIRHWLRNLEPRASRLVEPFAGGGTAALTAVFEGYVESAVMVEMDPDVASVWQAIFAGDGSELCDLITSFDLTESTVRAAISVDQPTRVQRAFATIVRNRVSRGGIMAPGAGIVKNGENGKGLRSRWYPETLQRRITAISAERSRFQIEQTDGLGAMMRYGGDAESAFFIDPPYVRAGRRLYTHSDIDHEALFSATANLAGPFLMTYDHHPDIELLSRRSGFATALVPMKSTHHACKYELLISRDLGWLTDQRP